MQTSKLVNNNPAVKTLSVLIGLRFVCFGLSRTSTKYGLLQVWGGEPFTDGNLYYLHYCAVLIDVHWLWCAQQARPTTRLFLFPYWRRRTNQPF